MCLLLSFEDAKTSKNICFRIGEQRFGEQNICSFFALLGPKIWRGCDGRQHDDVVACCWLLAVVIDTVVVIAILCAKSQHLALPTADNIPNQVWHLSSAQAASNETLAPQNGPIHRVLSRQSTAMALSLRNPNPSVSKARLEGYPTQGRACLMPPTAFCTPVASAIANQAWHMSNVHAPSNDALARKQSPSKQA